MRLSVKAMTASLSLIWGGCVLLVGLIHLANPNYGLLFLEMVASIYPGFQGAVRFGDVLIGTLYALVDGAIGGAVFAWLYNLFAGGKATHL